MLIDVHVPWHRIGHAILPLILTCGLFLTSVPTVLASSSRYYLSLGDSLAAGVSSDSTADDYTEIFFQYLQAGGVVTDYKNFGCPGETSYTYIAGGALKEVGAIEKLADPASLCYPNSSYPNSSQGSTALNYISQHPGQVSPITLDIGANDLLGDFDINHCTVNSNFGQDRQTLNDNLGGIVRGLRNTLVANGDATADILVLDYYDPYQHACSTIHGLAKGDESPDQLITDINGDLQQDISGLGTLVDIFKPFSGNICSYTGMCNSNLSFPLNIHPTAAGYQAIAQAIENAYPNH